MSLFDLFRKAFYNLVKDTNLTPKEREIFFSTSYLPSKKRYFRNIDLVTSYFDLIKKFPVFCDESILKECILLYNSSKQRRRRLKKRVEVIISKPSIFFTLTFTDYDLENLSFEQRRKAVCRFLKQFNSLYVANVDFGSENGREHYHGLIQVPKIELSSWRDKFGNINVKRVYSSTDSATKLAKYINKLTNHCIKNTCKRYSIIYSR
jgi:hypothetical protein